MGGVFSSLSPRLICSRVGLLAVRASGLCSEVFVSLAFPLLCSLLFTCGLLAVLVGLGHRERFLGTLC